MKKSVIKSLLVILVLAVCGASSFAAEVPQLKLSKQKNGQYEFLVSSAEKISAKKKRLGKNSVELNIKGDNAGLINVNSFSSLGIDYLAIKIVSKNKAKILLKGQNVAGGLLTVNTPFKPALGGHSMLVAVLVAGAGLAVLLAKQLKGDSAIVERINTVYNTFEYPKTLNLKKSYDKKIELENRMPLQPHVDNNKFWEKMSKLNEKRNIIEIQKTKNLSY